MPRIFLLSMISIMACAQFCASEDHPTYPAYKVFARDDRKVNVLGISREEAIENAAAAVKHGDFHLIAQLDIYGAPLLINAEGEDEYIDFVTPELKRCFTIPIRYMSRPLLPESLLEIYQGEFIITQELDATVRSVCSFEYSS